VRGVDQQPAILLGNDRHRRERGGGERLFDRMCLERVGRRAKVRVAALEQHARAEALETNDLRGACRAAIETERIGADSGGEHRQIEEILIEPLHLEQELACALVEVERDETVVPFHPGGLRRDGAWRGRLLRTEDRGRGWGGGERKS